MHNFCSEKGQLEKAECVGEADLIFDAEFLDEDSLNDNDDESLAPKVSKAGLSSIINLQPGDDTTEKCRVCYFSSLHQLAELRIPRDCVVKGCSQVPTVMTLWRGTAVDL